MNLRQMLTLKKHKDEYQAPTCDHKKRVDQAREIFGRPFAFEQGTTWKPRSVPLLTEWMQTRHKENQ